MGKGPRKGKWDRLTEDKTGTPLPYGRRKLGLQMVVWKLRSSYSMINSVLVKAGAWYSPENEEVR